MGESGRRAPGGGRWRGGIGKRRPVLYSGADVGVQLQGVLQPQRVPAGLCRTEERGQGPTRDPCASQPVTCDPRGPDVLHGATGPALCRPPVALGFSVMPQPPPPPHKSIMSYEPPPPAEQ